MQKQEKHRLNSLKTTTLLHEKQRYTPCFESDVLICTDSIKTKTGIIEDCEDENKIQIDLQEYEKHYKGEDENKQDFIISYDLGITIETGICLEKWEDESKEKSYLQSLQSIHIHSNTEAEVEIEQSFDYSLHSFNSSIFEDEYYEHFVTENNSTNLLDELEDTNLSSLRSLKSIQFDSKEYEISETICNPDYHQQVRDSCSLLCSLKNRFRQVPSDNSKECGKNPSSVSNTNIGENNNNLYRSFHTTHSTNYSGGGGDQNDPSRYTKYLPQDKIGNNVNNQHFMEIMERFFSGFISFNEVPNQFHEIITGYIVHKNLDDHNLELLDKFYNHYIYCKSEICQFCKPFIDVFWYHLRTCQNIETKDCSLQWCMEFRRKFCNGMNTITDDISNIFYSSNCQNILKNHLKKSAAILTEIFDDNEQNYDIQNMQEEINVELETQIMKTIPDGFEKVSYTNDVKAFKSFQERLNLQAKHEGLIWKKCENHLKILDNKYQNNIHYENIYKLGFGKQGAVFKAVDKKTNFKFAVKQEKIKDVEKLSEIETWAKLSHSPKQNRIIRLFGVIREGDYVYILMEFINGQSLSSLLDEYKQLGLKQTMKIIQDVSQQLSFIHSLDIVHEDIKTENVMMEGAFSARLIDFGMSHFEGKSFKGYRGSPFTFSPEKARSKPSKKSDVWAIGVLASHLLTGKRPWVMNTNDLHQMLFRIGKATEGPYLDGPSKSTWKKYPELLIFFKAVWLIDAEKRPSIEQVLLLSVFDESNELDDKCVSIYSTREVLTAGSILSVQNSEYIECRLNPSLRNVQSPPNDDNYVVEDSMVQYELDPNEIDELINDMTNKYGNDFLNDSGVQSVDDINKLLNEFSQKTDYSLFAPEYDQNNQNLFYMDVEEQHQQQNEAQALPQDAPIPAFDVLLFEKNTQNSGKWDNAPIPEIITLSIQQEPSVSYMTSNTNLSHDSSILLSSNSENDEKNNDDDKFNKFLNNVEAKKVSTTVLNKKNTDNTPKSLTSQNSSLSDSINELKNGEDDDEKSIEELISRIDFDKKDDDSIILKFMEVKNQDIANYKLTKQESWFCIFERVMSLILQSNEYKEFVFHYEGNRNNFINIQANVSPMDENIKRKIFIRKRSINDKADWFVRRSSDSTSTKFEFMDRNGIINF